MEVQLKISTELKLTVSEAQFEALTYLNQDLRLERNSTGELIVNPPTGGGTGKRNFSLNGQLYKWYEQYPELGEAFDSSTGFRLPNGANRSPDASWVTHQRWEELTEEQQEQFIPLCPDFVVELRSKSDRLEPLQAKMREYIHHGARLGWLIDRYNRRVEIYRHGMDVEILEQPAELSGEDILPGFVLNLRDLW